MSTDPFVASPIDDRPRQVQNLAPGVTMPAARSWRADRPGDLRSGQPSGELLGSPGPNVGYALTLASRARARLALAPHERADGAVAVIAELAMKRAASYGRAPVATDVECAALLLGYEGDVDPAFARWRVAVVHDATHDYPTRRALCDAVPLDALRLDPGALVGRVADVRGQLRNEVGARSA